MADPKSNSNQLINMNAGYEVNYWTKTLGISRDRLEELVRQYGYFADAIRQALNAA
jgi:hypothetical protein